MKNNVLGELLAWNSPWAEERDCSNLLVGCKREPTVAALLMELLEMLRTAGIIGR